MLDVDPRHGGDETLARLEAENGALPTTLVAITGGGGQHYLYKAPAEGFPNSAGALGPGLDTRGEGGYILLAGSNHVSGGVYEWVDPDAPLAATPVWLIEGAKRKARKAPAGKEPAGEAVIAEGGRNDTLTSMAGQLRRIGCSEAEMLAVLQQRNAELCRPPLGEDEVARIAASVGRYEPAAKSYERTEFGVSERFRDEHGGEVRFCGAFGWLGYDGKRWAEDGEAGGPEARPGDHQGAPGRRRGDAGGRG